ncbi:hypothetical protein ABID29_000477 [Streptococcus rupicaprae]|uniref:Uncharacterized protein n=1 Tax=Streptococcus rupicaprae TaxID=759619 RepID=A0ABV2FFW6_9STRE
MVERRNSIVKAKNTTAKDGYFSEVDQILASNVDQLFIVMALDQRFSLSK